jgi:hypothetical protein
MQSYCERSWRSLIRPRPSKTRNTTSQSERPTTHTLIRLETSPRKLTKNTTKKPRRLTKDTKMKSRKSPKNIRMNTRNSQNRFKSSRSSWRRARSKK